MPSVTLKRYFIIIKLYFIIIKAYYLYIETKQLKGIKTMARLEKLIKAVKRVGLTLNEANSHEEFITAETNYQTAVARLKKYANKFGKDAWYDALKSTEFANRDYRWESYRDYMQKQVS